MGKVIPEQVVTSQAPLTQKEGPQVQRAQQLRQQIDSTADALELDELDRMARTYARTPASGADDALCALATVVRFSPETFARVEVNLEPARLEALADRDRALRILDKAGQRFLDLVKDSTLEQGDEMVELLVVGYRRALEIPQERLDAEPRLRAAVVALAAYHDRVATEGAHRSAADLKADEKAAPKKRK